MYSDVELCSLVRALNTCRCSFFLNFPVNCTVTGFGVWFFFTNFDLLLLTYKKTLDQIFLKKKKTYCVIDGFLCKTEQRYDKRTEACVDSTNIVDPSYNKIADCVRHLIDLNHKDLISINELYNKYSHTYVIPVQSKDLFEKVNTVESISKKQTMVGSGSKNINTEVQQEKEQSIPVQSLQSNVVKVSNILFTKIM